LTSLVICNYRDKDLGTLARLINEADQVDDARFTTTAEALAHELADPRIQALDNVFLAVYDGFSDHWGSVDHTLDQDIHRQDWPNFRPERNLLAVDRDGHIAGLCLQSSRRQKVTCHIASRR